MHYKFITNTFNYYITQTLFVLLQSIGRRCTILEQYDKKDDTNTDVLYIITFPQHIEPMPKRYIVYQLEQLHHPRFGKSSEYRRKLKQAKLCWDYSMSNINIYSINTLQKWLPVPIMKIPKMFAPDCPKDMPSIDVLFYGTLNKRRMNILHYLHIELSKKGFKLAVLNTLFGERLHAYIQSSRVVVNIGYYEKSLLATYRINETMVHERVILSEKSFFPSDKHIMDQYEKGGVIFMEHIRNDLSNIQSQLIRPIMHLLENKKYYAACILKGKQFIQKKQLFFQYIINEHLNMVS